MRLLRLVDEAVSAGRFNSRADFLQQAGLTSGYLAEFETKRPNGTIRLDTARRIAALLGTPISAFTGDETEEPPVVDVYPGRAWAITAARALKYPEAAIQLVLKERASEDPGPLFWFRRIESEVQRIRPAPDVSSKPVESSSSDERRP